MKKSIKNVSVYELKPNMILAKDLIINGITLVAKEISLNESMIKKILEFYPNDNLYIYASEDETCTAYLTKFERT